MGYSPNPSLLENVANNVPPIMGGRIVRGEADMSRFFSYMEDFCFDCHYGVKHFFHDDGKKVTGKLRADPRCTDCLEGNEHTWCNSRAFNTNDAYKEED